MKEKVGGDQTDAVSLAVFEVDDGLSEKGDVLRVGALCGFGGESGLHHEPHLCELLKRSVVEEKEELHGDREDRGGVLVEVAAVTHLLCDDAHDLKHFESWTQRRAGDPKVCGELALRREFGPWREQPFAQELLEAEDEQLGDIFFVVEDVPAVAERGLWTFFHS